LLALASDLIGQETFECYKTPRIRVDSTVHDTHAATAQFSQDFLSTDLCVGHLSTEPIRLQTIVRFCQRSDDHRQLPVSAR